MNPPTQPSTQPPALPPLPTLSKKGYWSTLWPATIILLLIGLALQLIISISVSGQYESAYRMGHIAGTLLGLIIWPLLISWIVFRLSKRNRVATNIACLCLIGLVLFAGLARLVGERVNQRARNAAAIEELGTKLEAHRKELLALHSSPESTSEQIQLKEAKAIEIMAASLPHFSGQLKTAFSSFVSNTQATHKFTKFYYEANTKVADVALANLSEIKNLAEIDERILIIKNWRTTNRELRDASIQLRDNTAKYKNLDSVIERQFIQGVSKGLNASFPHIMEMRKSDDEYANTLIACLTLMQTEWGHFTFGESLFDTSFETAQAQDQFDRHLEQLDAIELQQDEIFKRLIN